MPVWHEALRKARDSEEIVMLGVTQEQHAERCRLFAQWKQFDWPIVQDPINLLKLQAVPILVAIDEQGVVQAVNPDLKKFRETFLENTREKVTSTATSTAAAEAKKPDIAALRHTAAANNTYAAWKDLGDALVLWSDEDALSEALAVYEKARTLQPRKAEIHFRLGVAYRMRYDAFRGATKETPSGPQQPGRDSAVGLRWSTLHKPRPSDFQLAVDEWESAMRIEPNHYIYRRRIQQYGPRLIKPYPFYDWVDQARKEIAARGEVPVKLSVEPSGAEVADSTKQFSANVEQREAPDPHGRIRRDTQGLIESEAVVVPANIRPGQSVRVHISFAPSADAHWNNESDPPALWVELPAGWQAEGQWFPAERPDTSASTEVRSIEFEVKPVASETGSARFTAYALYYVCDDTSGACMYLRRDFEISIDISE